MPPAWQTSAAAALGQVLELLHPGQVSHGPHDFDKRFLVLSYKNTFDWLWGLLDSGDAAGRIGGAGTTRPSEYTSTEPALRVNGQLTHCGLSRWVRPAEARAAHPKTLIILWDGIPEPANVGSVDLHNFVTPYDWAVAAASLLSREFQDDGGSQKLRVMILHLDADKAGDSDAVQFLFNSTTGGSAELIWVCSYHLSGASPDAGVFVELLSATLGGNEAEANHNAVQPNAVRWDLLKRLWAAKLLAPADPKDRHAIANLVGPQLLITAMSNISGLRTIPAPGLTALIILTKCLGLVPQSAGQVAAPWVITDGTPTRRVDFGGTKFVLVDDMYALGWEQFLRLALGLGGADERLFAVGSPTDKRFGPLGDSGLPDLLKDGSGRLRVDDSVVLYPGSADSIMFLDLRLFGTRPRHEELSFFKELLPLAKQTVGEMQINRRKLPWPGFTQDEVAAVERCLAREKVENDDYYTALTLLPRLLALADPTLPIVLFSSTGQRQVTNALREYGNIITDFDKPRFFVESPSGVAEETRIRFEKALSRASVLLDGRKTCASLNSQLRPKQLYPTPSLPPHIEIYLDESRQSSEQDFRVGGLALIFDSENAAADFNQEVVSNSLTWGPTDLTPTPGSVGFDKSSMPWIDYQEKVFGVADSLLQPRGGVAVAFSLSRPADVDWSEQGDLTNPACLDNLYRQLCIRSLEVLIYEVIPNALGQSVPWFSCAVYAATRIRTKSDADSESSWVTFPERFGVNLEDFWDQQGNKISAFTSVGADSVYPMVSEVRSLYPQADIRIVAARGGKLTYGLGRRVLRRELPRPAHYLADLIVRFSGIGTALNKIPTLSRWLERGFTSNAGERFASSLQACRYSREGRHVEAVLKAYETARSGQGGGVEPWARPRLSHSAAALSGRDFVDVSNRLQVLRPAATAL
jgi:hypothetical protein